MQIGLVINIDPIEVDLFLVGGIQDVYLVKESLDEDSPPLATGVTWRVIGNSLTT